MPQGYIEMRDAIKKQLIKRGMSEKEADKRAKSIASAMWNKKHPNNPVTRSDKK